MSTNQPLPPPPDSMIISYMTLRKVVGILGLSLAPILVLGSLIFDHPSKIQISVSAYYHTNMRDAMIGIICGIAFFLLSYNGYSKKDSIISKLTGLFALGIAFFPTSATNDKTDIISTLHYVTSGIFFALLAYMSIFLFTKTSGDMTPQKKKRNRVYRICGIIMAATMIGVPLSRINVIHELIASFKPTLVFETCALICFGISWLTKGEAILKDK